MKLQLLCVIRKASRKLSKDLSRMIENAIDTILLIE
jgi:hypothetical protein